MKKLVAIIGIVLLLGIYLTTFILAITSNPGTERLFTASIYATIIIPILLYTYMWLYKLLKNRENH